MAVPTRTPLFMRQRPGGVFSYSHIQEVPANAWFVDSSAAGAGDTVGHGANPDTPWATLAYAFSSAIPASGDVIYVMPGHAETIATPGGITQNIAGVKVIGLGWGAARPTFSFSATDSTWLITAASNGVKNVRVKSTVVELVNMFTISAADWDLDAVDVVDNTTNTVIQFLLTTAAADYGKLRNCRHYKGTAAAATEVWINLVGADFCLIENNHFALTLRNNAGAFTIGGLTTANLGLIIRNNVIYQDGGTTQDYVVKMNTGTTGIYADNRTFGNVGTLAGSIELASMAASNSFQATTVDKSGILDPVVA